MRPNPSVTSARPDASSEADSELAAMVAATPASRDRSVDFLRGLAIAFVAIGHWLVVVPTYTDGTFDGVNALGTVPVMRWLSWVFQVMPLFFIVGGFANAVSWRSARRRGQSWSTWTRSRFGRLLRPTGVFLGTWIAAGVLARQLGIDPHLVHTMAWLVVVPLWFLAVYVVVVALAPPMLRLHERAGVVAPVVLVALATAVDVVRIHFAVEPVAYLNFLFVFLFCQQLGFFWLEGRLSRRRWWPATMLVGGVAALWLLTHVGPYPLSMVGVPGERIANNAPPTITFVALGLAQIGLVMVLRRPMDRWLRRPRVWGSVIAVNAHAMTVHLWHLTALVIVAVVVLPLHVVPVLEDGTGGWWLSRVLALPVLSLPLLALVLTFGRYERRGAPAVDEPARPALATAATVLAVPCLSIALMLVTLNGLSIEGAPAGVPMVPIALLAVGSALLLVGRRGDDRSVGEGEGPVEQVGLLGGVHAGDTCGR